MEHTGNRRVAREIAMDHLSRDSEYYIKLKMVDPEDYEENRARDPSERELAVRMRTVFADRPPKHQLRFHWGWPRVMQHVGESLAVAYSSDKWRADGDMLPYKHLAESRNVAFVRPGFLLTPEGVTSTGKVIGPRVSFARVPKPKYFAFLGLFEEANFRLFTSEQAGEPQLGKKPDDGCVQVLVRHGMVAGAHLMWRGGRGPEPVLFVYTEREGVLMVVMGEKLDVQKDGIVG
jgi:hypothetical protein